MGAAVRGQATPSHLSVNLRMQVDCGCILVHLLKSELGNRGR